MQLDYGSNLPSWTFGSKHPLHFSRDIPLLNNPLKWYLTLEKLPLKDLQMNDLSKILAQEL